MNRILRQAKSLEGSVEIPSSFQKVLRITLSSLFAEGISTIDPFPKCVASENLLRFTHSFFPDRVERSGSILSIKGFGGFTLSTLPDAIDFKNESDLLLFFLPLYLRRGGRMSLDVLSSTQKLDRLIKYLDSVGFYIDRSIGNNKLTITITPASPDSVTYQLLEADEEIKTALLFSLLNSSGTGKIIETTPLSDESEKMLAKIGVSINSFRKGEALDEEDDYEKNDNNDELTRRIRKIQAKKEAVSAEKPNRTILFSAAGSLNGNSFTLGGDPLCAAPFLLAATLVARSSITVKSIEGSATGGFFSAMRRMGASFNSERNKDKNSFDCTAGPTKLVGRKISGELTADVGDLLPFIAVAAAYAEGQTVIRDANFLRDDKKDIIALTINNLKAMGTKVGEIEDGFVIEGSREHDGAEFETGGVPSIGMAFSIAAIKNRGESVIKNAEAIDMIFPDFLHRLESLVKEDKQEA